MDWIHIKPAFLSVLLLLSLAVMSQNVGIGTVSPLYPADILDSTSGTVLRLRTASTTAGDRTLLRFTTSTSNSINGFNSSYIGNERQSIGTALVFGTTNSGSLASFERMRLSEDGFLGIGTTNPQARLHIDMSNINTTTQAMIINDDDDLLVNFQRNNTNYGFLQVLGTDFKIGTTINNNVGNLVIRTNGADRAWFTAGGRVGLGTSTPATQLHMTGELTMQSSNPVIQMKDAAGDDKAFIQMINGDDMMMGTNAVNTTGSFIIRNNGANRLTVTNNGYVGIGTTSPQADLHIESSILPNPLTINTVGQRFIEFQRSGLPRTYFKFENDDISMGTYDNTSGRVIFETEETDRMIIHANGRISMNSSYNNAGYRLAVNGDIICVDITTLPFASWPDYVFKSGYKLQPLSEVEAFVKKNGHLPGIPAAAEVKKNGIMLGEMQRKTIEKVEELTLYIIELKKEIEALKNKN